MQILCHTSPGLPTKGLNGVISCTALLALQPSHNYVGMVEQGTS